MWKTLRYLWPFPVTLVGLLLAGLAVLSRGTVTCREGVLEVQGGFAGWLLRGGWFWQGAAAMTLGHVIFARNADCLEHSRTHELQHVRQYECWGPLLPPVYWLIALWLRVRGYHPYLDHPLEPPGQTEPEE